MPAPTATAARTESNDADLPLDDTLCPGEAMHGQHLRQLLRAALPDSSHHKAAGWFGQTDFLFTRHHVDEEQDSYHDGLFITLWKRWDFWLALPDDATASHGTLLAQTWARLRHPAQPTLADGLLRQYRAYDQAGRPGPWQPLDADHASPEALQACTQAWRDVIDYWRRAEGQRRAGRPLRARLHAALTPARVQALTLLPVFTGRYNDWWNPERNGWWQGDVWIGARQPGQQGSRHWGRALKLSWRNGSEAAGDEEDDAHACYQIDLVEDDAAPNGTAHPPGLRLSHSQRQSDARRPFTNDAVEHMQRLLQLFTDLEQQLYAAHAREQQALQSTPASQTGAAPALPRRPPFAPDEADADVFGPAIMALSHEWQHTGRAHATLVRAQWAGQAERMAQANAPAQPGSDAPEPPPLVDPRSALAATVLQLAHAVQAQADADLCARFHRRFAFAPGAFAHHAARDGQAVGPLLWQADGRLLACVGQPPATAETWWQLGADGQHITPLPAAQAPGMGATGSASATAHGLMLQGDEHGDLLGLAEDGSVLWRHHIGGTIRSIAPAPDGHTLAVGTAGGYLVLLHKGSGTDPYLVSSSRYAELRRFIFWDDVATPLAW